MNTDLKTWVRAEWDRVAGFGLLAAGVVVLLFGYIGVSNSTDTPEALCYVVSGGIGSLLLFGAGAVLLISADLHDEWRKLHRIEAALGRLAGDEPLTVERRDHRDSPDADPDDIRPGMPAAGLRSLARSGGGAADGRMAMVEGGPATLAAPLRIGASGIAVSAAALGLAWWRTADQLTSRAAYGGVAAGLGALLLSVLFGAAALAWSRRAVERHKTGVLSTLLDLPADGPGERGATVSGTWPADEDGRVAVADGLTEYHRPSCLALPTRSVRTVPADAVPPGLRPCRLCEA